MVRRTAPLVGAYIQPGLALISGVFRWISDRTAPAGCSGLEARQYVIRGLPKRVSSDYAATAIKWFVWPQVLVPIRKLDTCEGQVNFGFLVALRKVTLRDGHGSWRQLGLGYPFD